MFICTWRAQRIEVLSYRQTIFPFFIFSSSSSLLCKIVERNTLTISTTSKQRRKGSSRKIPEKGLFSLKLSLSCVKAGDLLKKIHSHPWSALKSHFHGLKLISKIDYLWRYIVQLISHMCCRCSINNRIIGKWLELFSGFEAVNTANTSHIVKQKHVIYSPVWF